VTTWLNLRESVKNVYFAVIVLAGVLMLVVSSFDLGSIYGTPTYPVTYMVLELIRDVFALFILIVTTLLRRRDGLARARRAHGRR
jgi:ABC-2 type transport system permease protein